MLPVVAPRVSGSLVRKARKSGDVFYAKYRVGGRQHKRKIGPVWTEKGRPPLGYYTRRMAQDVLDGLLTDLRRQGAPEPKLATYTLKQACDDWLSYVEHDKGRAPTTMSDYRRAVKNHFIPGFGADTPLAQITTDQVDAWITMQLAEGKLSRATIRKNRVLLNSVLKLAKRRKHVTANPVEDAETVIVPRSGEFNVLTVEEVHAVIRHAHDEQDATIFTVAAFAGLRMGELRALRWRDIDFAGSTIHVRRSYTHCQESTPKSGKVRSVPLIDQAATALDGLSRRGYLTDPTDLVFVAARGGYIYEGELRRRFYVALEAADLGHKREGERPITFHDLRHTFGTLAVKVWDLRKVQGYMGHADITTTMGYVHHVPKTTDADALTALVEESAAVPQAV